MNIKYKSILEGLLVLFVFFSAVALCCIIEGADLPTINDEEVDEVIKFVFGE